MVPGPRCPLQNLKGILYSKGSASRIWAREKRHVRKGNLLKDAFVDLAPSKSTFLKSTLLLCRTIEKQHFSKRALSRCRTIGKDYFSKSTFPIVRHRRNSILTSSLFVGLPENGKQTTWEQETGNRKHEHRKQTTEHIKDDT